MASRRSIVVGAAVVRRKRTGTVVRVCTARDFSTSQNRQEENKSFKLLIVGGGTGGSATAHKFCNRLGKGNVAVIEPSSDHYYQPLWTLVGGGRRRFEESQGTTKDVLPKNCVWIQDRAMEFDPDNCTVKTEKGDVIKYDYLVCGMGLQLNYHLIKGLPEGFDIDPQLCSNYSYKFVQKTRPAMENFKEGNAIFTFPNTPIKCAGAPQKIMYLTEEYFRQSGKRDKANVIFNTSLGVIFGVKKYANALIKIVAERDIKVNFKHNLIEVRPDKREAVFEKLDPETNKPTGETVTMDYAFLHITPPMSTPDPLRKSPLVDSTGFVTVTKETLQHTKYPNVFAIGDNTDAPKAKTAAAVGSEVKVLAKNLRAVMDGKQPTAVYDGYTSCPIVTAHNKVILAEFDYNAEPLETFPFDQSKERRSMYLFKSRIFPPMYWYMLTRGLWHGPGLFRKILHFGMSK